MEDNHASAGTTRRDLEKKEGRARERKLALSEKLLQNRHPTRDQAPMVLVRHRTIVDQQLREEKAEGTADPLQFVSDAERKVT